MRSVILRSSYSAAILLLLRCDPPPPPPPHPFALLRQPITALSYLLVLGGVDNGACLGLGAVEEGLEELLDGLGLQEEHEGDDGKHVPGDGQGKHCGEGHVHPQPHGDGPAKLHDRESRNDGQDDLVRETGGAGDLAGDLLTDVELDGLCGLGSSGDGGRGEEGGSEGEGKG